MFTDPFSELSVFDKTATVALYLTVAFIVLAAVIGILIKKFRPENYPEYPKRVMSAASGYAIGILALLMYLKLDEYIADGYIDMPTFLPVVIMLGIMIVAVVAALVIAAFKPEISALFTKIAVAAIGVGILVVIIVSMVNTYKGGIERSVGEEVQLYVYTAILIAVIAALALVFGKKTPVPGAAAGRFDNLCQSRAADGVLVYVRDQEGRPGGYNLRIPAIRSGAVVLPSRTVFAGLPDSVLRDRSGGDIPRSRSVQKIARFAVRAGRRGGVRTQIPFPRRFGNIRVRLRRPRQLQRGGVELPVQHFHFRGHCYSYSRGKRVVRVQELY